MSYFEETFKEIFLLIDVSIYVYQSAMNFLKASTLFLHLSFVSSPFLVSSQQCSKSRGDRWYPLVYCHLQIIESK